MPLVRFQVRNEYSLGQPELYKNVNKEDPRALLEGVAVSGLVGILRQLGELSEFAVEVFHGLQEQVVSTAHRSHKLTARVQHMEDALSRVEKALFSQTSHIHFAYIAGSVWHPRFFNQQKHFFYNGMPLNMMSSYEECRHPPQLDLLDKFDIGGPGSCLGRYSDPSFFRRVSSAHSEAYALKRIRNTKGVHRNKDRQKRSVPWDREQLRGTSSSRHSRRTQSVTFGAIDKSFHSMLDIEPRVGLEKRSHSFISRKGSDYIEYDINSTGKAQTNKEVYNRFSSFLSDSQNNDRNISICPLDRHVISSSPLSHPLMQKTSPASSHVNGEEEMKMVEQVDRNIDLEPLELHSIGEHATTGENQSFESKYQVVSEHVPCFIPAKKEFEDVDSESDNFLDALNTIESEPENDIDCVTKEEFRGQSLPYVSELTECKICEHAILPEGNPMSLASDNASISTCTLSSMDLSNSALSEHGLSPSDFNAELTDHEQIITDACSTASNRNLSKLVPVRDQVSPHSFIQAPRIPSCKENRMAILDGHFWTDVVDDSSDDGCLPEFGIQGCNGTCLDLVPKSVNGLSPLPRLEFEIQGSGGMCDEMMPESVTGQLPWPHTIANASHRPCYEVEVDSASTRHCFLPDDDDYVDKKNLPSIAIHESSLAIVDIHESNLPATYIDCSDDMRPDFVSRCSSHGSSNSNLSGEYTEEGMVHSLDCHFSRGDNDPIDEGLLDVAEDGFSPRSSLLLYAASDYTDETKFPDNVVEAGSSSSKCSLVSLGANDIADQSNLKEDTLALIRSSSSPSVSNDSPDRSNVPIIHIVDASSSLRCSLLLDVANDSSDQSNLSGTRMEAGSYSSRYCLLPVISNDSIGRNDLRAVSVGEGSPTSRCLLPIVASGFTDPGNLPKTGMEAVSPTARCLFSGVSNDCTCLSNLKNVGEKFGSSSRSSVLPDISDDFTDRSDLQAIVVEAGISSKCIFLPIDANDDAYESKFPDMALDDGLSFSRCSFLSDAASDFIDPSDLPSIHVEFGYPSALRSLLPLVTSNSTTVSNLINIVESESSFSRCNMLPNVANNSIIQSDFPATVMKAPSFSLCILLPDVSIAFIYQSNFSDIGRNAGCAAVRCSLLSDVANGSTAQNELLDNNVVSVSPSRQSLLPVVSNDLTGQSNLPDDAEAESSSGYCALPDVANDSPCQSYFPDTIAESGSSSRSSLLDGAVTDLTDWSNLQDVDVDDGYSILRCSLSSDAAFEITDRSDLATTYLDFRSPPEKNLLPVSNYCTEQSNQLDIDVEVEYSSKCSLLPDVTDSSPGQGDLSLTAVKAVSSLGSNLLPHAAMCCTDHSNLPYAGVADGCSSLICSLLPDVTNETANQSNLRSSYLMARSPSWQGSLFDVSIGSMGQRNLPDIAVVVESFSRCVSPDVSNSSPDEVDSRTATVEDGSSSCRLLPDSSIDSPHKSNLHEMEDVSSSSRCLLRYRSNGSTNQSDLQDINMESASPSCCSLLTFVNHSADQSNFPDIYMKSGFSSTCGMLPEVATDQAGQNILPAIVLEAAPSLTRCSLPDGSSQRNLPDGVEGGSFTRYVSLSSVANDSANQSGLPTLCVEDGSSQSLHSLLPHTASDFTDHSDIPAMAAKTASTSRRGLSYVVSTDAIAENSSCYGSDSSIFHGEEVKHEAHIPSMPPLSTQIWTNGSLLGLEPSKPVDFSHSNAARPQTLHMCQDSNGSYDTVELGDSAGDLFSNCLPDDTYDELCKPGRNIMPSSPPLGFMELSWHPFSCSEVSQLKLRFNCECKDKDGLIFTLPSFQMVHEQTLPSIDVSLDSDNDDAFYKSSPCSSDGCPSELYESNSEDWEGQQVMESKYKELYDEALSRIDLESSSSGSMGVRFFKGWSEKEHSHSDALHDLPSLCTANYSVVQSENFSANNSFSRSQNLQLPELPTQYQSPPNSGHEVPAKERKNCSGSVFLEKSKLDQEKWSRTQDAKQTAGERVRQDQNFLQQIKTKNTISYFWCHR